MKSSSYSWLRHYGVATYVLKNEPRSVSQVARLKNEAIAKASLKRRQSLGYDPKPNDLLLSRSKFSERRMEGRTVVVCKHSNDLRIGVKSLSSSAMAGSCRNMPKYSLV